jgi:DNA-binding NarL/FixJ family response regulator
MNGLEAVASVVREFPEIRVVFVSSDDSAQLKRECMALGSLAVAPKLTSQAELCSLSES